MKQFILVLTILSSFGCVSQNSDDKAAIENTLNNYIDAFYKGDTLKLKAAITPKLYKFGYKRNETSGEYNFYAQMNFQDAMAFVTKMKI